MILPYCKIGLDKRSDSKVLTCDSEAGMNKFAHLHDIIGYTNCARTKQL